MYICVYNSVSMYKLCTLKGKTSSESKNASPCGASLPSSSTTIVSVASGELGWTPKLTGLSQGVQLAFRGEIKRN